MKLPILISVPHAGLQVPVEARKVCRLSPEEIVADGDEGASEIYAINDEVSQYITTDIARAIVDLNRAADDFRRDGVIKTHTCWNVPVYNQYPPRDVIDSLLLKYHLPYHHSLEVDYKDVRLSVDCHTMAEFGPPVGPDTAQRRPHVCLGDDRGKTLPAAWMPALAKCFRDAFSDDVAVNEPFSGGYITREHGRRRPWVQVELSRGPFMSNAQKRAAVLKALSQFCTGMFR